VSYKTEVILRRYSIAPFHTVASVFSADQSGLSWAIQSRVFRWVVRNKFLVNVRWYELARVELSASAERPVLRLFPRSTDRFRYKIAGIPHSMQFNIGPDGSLALVSGERAQQLYGVCSRYVENRDA